MDGTGSQADDTPDPKPVSSLPARPGDSILKFTVVPIGILIGLLMAAGTLIAVLVENGGLVFFFILPAVMLLGLTIVPFAIWAGIANSRPAPDTGIAPTVSTSAGEWTVETTVPVNRRGEPLARWRWSPSIVIPALLVWYVLLTAVCFGSVYAYAWQQEADPRSSDLLQLVPFLAWAVGFGWVAVFRWPRKAAERAGLSVLIGLILAPIAFGIAVNTGYDAGRDAYRKAHHIVPPPPLDITGPVVTGGDSIPVPPVSSGPHTPENISINPEFGLNYPTGTAATGDYIFLLLPGTPPAPPTLTPAPGWVHIPALNQAVFDGYDYAWQLCAPGDYTWTGTTGNGTPFSGTLTVTGPDLCNDLTPPGDALLTPNEP